MVYLTITTSTPTGQETSLAAVRDASQVDATVAAVLAARVRQGSKPARWATVAEYCELTAGQAASYREWAVEVVDEK